MGATHILKRSKAEVSLPRKCNAVFYDVDAGFGVP